MAKLSLQGEQNIAAVERWLRELEEATVEQGLAVNTTLRNAQVGGVAAQIQLILSWSKKFPNGKLFLHTNQVGLAERHLENLASLDHGLVALLVAKDVVTSDGVHSLKERANWWALRSLDEMIGARRPGPDIFLIAADETIKAHIPQFYYPDSEPYGVLQTQAGFEAFAAQQIQGLATKHQYSLEPDAELTEHLATILYELFKNTHLWAQSELDGSKVVRSVRGIRLSLTRVATTAEEALTAAHKEFLTQLRRNSSVTFDLCEIDVFDKGPGLAARGLDHPVTNDVTIEQERDALRSRLLKHATSSERTHHGAGLVEVMDTLTRGKCFLRIRSGHLALQRDFVAHPRTGEDDVWLQDEGANPSQLGRQPWADGVLVSILLPIFHRRGRSK